MPVRTHLTHTPAHHMHTTNSAVWVAELVDASDAVLPVAAAIVAAAVTGAIDRSLCRQINAPRLIVPPLQRARDKSIIIT
jgi:hypothetical protein